MPTAQNGWPASGDKNAIGVDSNFAVAGVKFPGGVKAGPASVVLGYVAQQFHNRVEKLVSGWCWGYAYRDIRGSTGLSNHAAACAIDVNAPNHPLGKKGTFSAAQVKEINKIVAECGGVVRWGGSYVGRVDEMHFELVGSEQAVANVAGRLGTGTGGAGSVVGGGAAASGGTSGTTLSRGSTGEPVRQLQRVLNAWYPHLHLVEDGIYGPATEAGVKELQRRAKLVVDGIAGPKTLGYLGIA